MKPTLALLPLLAGTIVAGSAFGQDAPSPVSSDPDAEILEVELVERGPTDMRFVPDDFEVQRGDVIRFVQKGDVPHTVDFADWPEEASVGDDLRDGPFLTTYGETYEIEIDGRFAPGEYHFQCTPHVAFGQVGTFTVLGEEEDRN